MTDAQEKKSWTGEGVGFWGEGLRSERKEGGSPLTEHRRHGGPEMTRSQGRTFLIVPRYRARQMELVGGSHVGPCEPT